MEYPSIVCIRHRAHLLDGSREDLETEVHGSYSSLVLGTRTRYQRGWVNDLMNRPSQRIAGYFYVQ